MSASTFLARLPQDAIEEREIVATAFRIVDAVSGKVAEIRKNGHLTEIGQREQIKQTAKGGLLDHFRQIQGRAARITAENANLRKGIKLKAPDKSDLFAEMQRQEIRVWLRSLPEADRMRVALEADPQIAEAIVHATPALSGLSAELHSRVVDNAVEQSYGPQLQGIERRQEVIDTINAALQVAAMQYRNEAGLAEEEFSK